ncbi:dNTP-hexose glycosyl transferase [Amycolatopsis oliviviridis]|uniref:DNTP-hexose glycosyl transferase n=1 Tax=Amycolatopsis oliviviridis TaxID=1471590 RepID=A0ABQ3L5N2_9PSEU|nr:dNTP-hexose glycosyl transferase [Amycolatopsis oliviviridis]
MFVAAGFSPASVFALAPLATSLRNAGHEVVMAAFDELTPTITAVGLPAVSFETDETTKSIMTMDRPGGPINFPTAPDEEAWFLGAWFGRQAAVGLPGLVEFSRRWRPDVVIGGTLDYATPMLGATLDVPHVRQAWDWMPLDEAHPHADVELAPELAALGLDHVPQPDLLVDICPPSLHLPEHNGARMMRWISGNRQRKLEPWMYTKASRPRVCVTLGSRREAGSGGGEYLDELVEQLGSLEVDVVVAATESLAEELRARHPGIRADWLPLEFILPTCDVIVHHNGGLTAMNAMDAGVPQVILDRFKLLRKSTDMIERHGSSLVIHDEDNTPSVVAGACASILADAEFARRARALSAEIRALPAPPQIVADLEKIAVPWPG